MPEHLPERCVSLISVIKANSSDFSWYYITGDCETNRAYICSKNYHSE